MSAEADIVRERFSCDMLLPADLPRLNDAATLALPPLSALRDVLRRVSAVDWLIAEGPAGFLWTAVVRDQGFGGGATILPYLNPRRWRDVAAAALYARFQDPRDRVYVGSTPSARIYRQLGVTALVGEPYGIDDRRFHPRPHAADVRRRRQIPHGRVLLFAGRAQPDKDLYRLLRIALKARILFPDLQIVLASHVIDEAYMSTIRRELGPASGVHLIEQPDGDDLADLYCVADVFVTVATSHFETFGRAPAEALACGTPVIAPRYDGFAEVLDQPGGHLVDVEIDESGPHVREDELLRAIYDVLSRPDRVPAALVSITAQRRFARSRTIELLAHVVHHEPSPPTDRGDEDDCEALAVLAWPPGWERALQRIRTLPTADALDYVWACHGDGSGTDLAALSAADGSFVESVRRALCVIAPRAPAPRHASASAAEPGDAA